MAGAVDYPPFSHIAPVVLEGFSFATLLGIDGIYFLKVLFVLLQSCLCVRLWGLIFLFGGLSLAIRRAR